jgi:tRNA(Ile)-lysidine synthase
VRKFVRELITEWRRLELPVSKGTLVIAVSGGADSVSLLLATHDLVRRKKLGHRIVVAHFDHGLRGAESEADAEFVRGLAERLGLDIRMEKGNVRKRGNIEQEARNARYEFLSIVATAENAYGILTGHTINDQAETFLMNLIRGSGPDGLRAMPVVREIGKDGKLLIRPLMRWAKREDTERFCREQGLEFREDSMNCDRAFTRVRIRKEVLPLLGEFNPKIIETLAQTAGMLGRESEAGEKSIPIELSLAELNALDCLDLRNRLRSWIRSVRGDLRGLKLKHIEGIERLAKSKKSGRIAELPGGWQAVKRAGRLRLVQIKVEKRPPEN